MSARRTVLQTARNSMAVANFAFNALVLFSVVGVNIGLLVMLVPFAVPSIITLAAVLVAFATVVVTVYRQFPEPHLIRRATEEIWSWSKHLLPLGAVLGICNYLVELHG